MSDHRKVINPLLNISVTGATLEDFSQNAVLLPAAEAPPVLQPPQPPAPTLQPTSEITLVPNSESQSIPFTNFANNNPGNQNLQNNYFYTPVTHQQQFPPQNQQFQPQNQEFQALNSLNQQFQPQFPHLQPENQQFQPEFQQFQPPNQQFQPQNQQFNPPNQETGAILQEYPQNQLIDSANSNFQQPNPQQQQPAGLQSVLSSFSSYLKLGGRQQQQQEEITPVPSVVDSLLGSVDPNAPVVTAPVQFYSPDTAFSAPKSVDLLAPTTQSTPPLPGVTPPPAQPANTYRRGGFKRPAYAQIPGLSTAGGASSAIPTSQVQPPINLPPLPPQVNQNLVNLPPRPPSTHSPFAPSFNQQQNTPSPLPFQQSSDFGQVPTSNFAVPPLPTSVPSIPGTLPFQNQSIPVSAAQIPAEIPEVVPVPTYSVPLIPVKQPTPPLPAQILHPTFLPPAGNQVESSPFLSEVSAPEELQLSAAPGIPTSVPLFNTFSNQSATPTILTPTTYYPATSLTGHSTLITTDMSKSSGDSPRSSPGIPGLNANQRSESVDQPILTPSVNATAQMYRPVYHHWFYKVATENKVTWKPFSMVDSLNLDSAYLSPDLSPEKLVPTDGGRYDVNILLRERVPVYWEGAKAEVRRCSWFHKSSTDGKFAPYEENVATKLEEEFKIAFESNTWNRKVELANGETVVFHGPDVLVLFPQTECPDSWGNTPNQPRPRVVKRGLDEFHIEEGEPEKVDHLLFMVHGIGKFCDLKFRGVEEAVDDFRSMALQLVQSHYKSSCEKEIANRIEILPVSWHFKLHSEETGVDKKMKGITLESIPRLREFTNDTILDVLFYTSPVYCQTIISSVGNELNRIYDLFKQRNPSFTGGISLGGHSLGSLILFDILCHQHPENEKPAEEEAPPSEEVHVDDLLSPLSPSLKPPPDVRKMSRRISYMMAQMGTGQAQINYPSLTFSPRHFFALGSPVGMFVTVRGLENLGVNFALPTCPAYFNIFHPYDPVAYRVESLINPELAGLKPVLIPHHKGRKRMHLELKETMARVGADLKQKLMDSMKSTWNSFYQFTLFKGQPSAVNAPSLEEEVNKVLEEQLKQDGNTSDEDSIVEAEQTDLNLGQLNGGRRIDYVLQEAPFEVFNEYIFALTSHVCYWESNDTILLIVKEIYNSMDISADSQMPQPTMTIERTTSTSSNDESSNPSTNIGRGVDPTVPMHTNTNIGPPPMAGFVRKS